MMKNLARMSRPSAATAARTTPPKMLIVVPFFAPVETSQRRRDNRMEKTDVMAPLRRQVRRPRAMRGLKRTVR